MTSFLHSKDIFLFSVATANIFPCSDRLLPWRSKLKFLCCSSSDTISIWASLLVINWKELSELCSSSNPLSIIGYSMSIFSIPMPLLSCPLKCCLSDPQYLAIVWNLLDRLSRLRLLYFYASSFLGHGHRLNILCGPYLFLSLPLCNRLK